MHPKTSPIAALDLPGTVSLPVAEAAPEALGKVKHGLDSDSAVERLAAEKTRPSDCTPLTYPHNIESLAHEMVDHVFREPFTDKNTNDHPDLLKQAQEVARQCMSEMLSGNEFMRLTPEALQDIQQSLLELTEHVTHEALKLYRSGHKRMAKSKDSSHNLRREIREEISRTQPVKHFKERYLGWAASVEASREAGLANGKQTQ